MQIILFFGRSRSVYYFVFIVLPIYTGRFYVLACWLSIFALVAGFVLSIVFQLAHTVEHTHFPVPDEATGKLEDEWAIHQLKTTANFAPKNKFLSWMVGGLNFQIEHHLFPKISHIHYSKIRNIIKQACADYDVPYIEYPKDETCSRFACQFSKSRWGGHVT